MTCAFVWMPEPDERACEFSDGTANELATLSGSSSAGYVAALQIGI